MATVENALLRQMQKLAASMNAMQGAVSKDKSAQASVSFREMLRKPGDRVSEGSKEVREIKDKLVKGDREPDAGLQPVIPRKEKAGEELKAELLGGNPNAVNVMDLFRPDIVENTEQVETVLNPIPQETVEGAAMDLGGQAPAMEADVDADVGAEVSMEQQPRDFQQTMEETPQETAGNVQPQQQQQQTAPERPVQQTAERPEQEIEVRVERTERPVDTREAEDTEESGGEAAAAEQPVFHETQSVPVKVGERYEVVDTEKPEMDNKLAKTVNDAVQLGQDRVEIRLNPQNLGSLVIEMTKDTNGVLQVVLHAATPKAEGVLNQHLNNLHTALQGYGHEEIRLEVQRGQQSEQQNFRQADPDGRGQHHHRQQQERQEEQHSGEEFMQKLRLGLFGMED